MSSNDEQTITILKSEYLSLLKDSQLLDCLNDIGVDNWEGFGAAVELYEEEYAD